MVQLKLKYNIKMFKKIQRAFKELNPFIYTSSHHIIKIFSGEWWGLFSLSSLDQKYVYILFQYKITRFIKIRRLTTKLH